MAQFVVECSKGHHFTTQWVPLISFKAVRLGSERYQWCPSCRRFRLIHRVRRA